MKKIISMLLLFLISASIVLNAAENQPQHIKILFIAGQKSHPCGVHEFYAGSVLLADILQSLSGKTYDNGEVILPKIETSIHRNAKQNDTYNFDNTDVIVVFADGGQQYPLKGHEAELEKLQRAGKGFVFLHYALCGSQGNDQVKPNEPPKDAVLISKLTGGFYEIFHSVNPSYTAEFKHLPKHPITRGVRPFTIEDEWYFHMRFQDDLTTEQIIDKPLPNSPQAILITTPPNSTKTDNNGAHSGNPTVRNRLNKPEIVAWATQRIDGGRGFGFTGGDQHWNFAHPDYRKLLLNAIIWTAKIDIPKNGIDTLSPKFDELKKNIDKPSQLTSAMEERIRGKIDSWNK
ncbi:MAG: ThuA domain-containing protein [Planctomycetaceae bacterium]|jgi:hypothetical protein|nr:ThuA domain-containing protein [Planctomycetaceae bacterium]